MEASTRVGLRFCPLEYIKKISCKSSPVGRMVSIDECEVDNIILGIDIDSTVL